MRFFKKGDFLFSAIIWQAKNFLNWDGIAVLFCFVERIDSLLKISHGTKRSIETALTSDSVMILSAHKSAAICVGKINTEFSFKCSEIVLKIIFFIRINIA